MLGSKLSRVSKNTGATQGGSNLTTSVNTHPKGMELGKVREAGEWERYGETIIQLGTG